MSTFAIIQKIIDEAGLSGLPSPVYVTVSMHENGTPGVSFQFRTPNQVEQWACHDNADLIKSPADGHVTYAHTLLGDEFNVHCYCLVYDSEQVPA